MYISSQLPVGSEHRIYSAESQSLIFESRKQELMEYIRQRNNISRLLNLKQQQIVGQMECEVEFIYLFIFVFLSVGRMSVGLTVVNMYPYQTSFQPLCFEP